ncbi:hypothetical protein GGX14DRAFT_661963 [Mycena pura]|uniref:HNH nuclease domain-containing protein n=1 Tax=Mycena pura TaxID=153505 RepID=A0AAD6V4L6_9AGAR|nr:hypothetical protein GGX14DRAFT_661963 [Mycena pura]
MDIVAGRIESIWSNASMGSSIARLSVVYRTFEVGSVCDDAADLWAIHGLDEFSAQPVKSKPNEQNFELSYQEIDLYRDRMHSQQSVKDEANRLRQLNHEGESVWPHILEAENAAKLDALQIPGVVVGTKKEAQARHAKLQNLGLYFRNHLMRVFRSNGGPAPKLSDHSSRPSLDATRDEVINDIRNRTTLSGARSFALVRDGYRCMLTEQYDLESSVTYPELVKRAAVEGRTLAGTQCAHIFSETAVEGKANLEYAAGVMAILEAFDLTSKIEHLVSRNVHKDFNILTIQTDLHLLFDRLEIWLEEVIGEPNTYTVCSVDDRVSMTARPPPRRLTFRVDPDLEAACVAKGTPLLRCRRRIRAACSRVAHMSGAAEQVDRLVRDLEETPAMGEALPTFLRRY